MKLKTLQSIFIMTGLLLLLSVAHAQSPFNSQLLTHPDIAPVTLMPLDTDIPSFAINSNILHEDISGSPLLLNPDQDEEASINRYIKLYGFAQYPFDSSSQEEGSISSGFSKLGHFIMGKPAENMLPLGLWSHHILTHRHFRQDNNMIGLQYNGLFACTFANSYSQQTFAVGIARTLYEADFWGKNLRYTLGYKIGPMYGYVHDKGVPNIGGFSILPILVNGITLKFVGVDFNLVPGNALSFNLHFENPKKQSVY
jgi:hypothetical protein